MKRFSAVLLAAMLCCAVVVPAKKEQLPHFYYSVSVAPMTELDEGYVDLVRMQEQLTRRIEKSFPNSTLRQYDSKPVEAQLIIAVQVRVRTFTSADWCLIYDVTILQAQDNEGKLLELGGGSFSTLPGPRGMLDHQHVRATVQVSSMVTTGIRTLIKKLVKAWEEEQKREKVWPYDFMDKE